MPPWMARSIRPSFRNRVITKRCATASPIASASRRRRCASSDSRLRKSGMASPPVRVVGRSLPAQITAAERSLIGGHLRLAPKSHRVIHPEQDRMLPAHATEGPESIDFARLEPADADRPAMLLAERREVRPRLGFRRWSLPEQTRFVAIDDVMHQVIATVGREIRIGAEADCGHHLIGIE